MQHKQINFGIVGTGWIAQKAVEALNKLPQARAYAIASRTETKARQFASEGNIPNAYGSYQELMDGKDVDIVYIATPHNRHHPEMLMALNAGKHVLCEKPLTLNAAQARECIQLAKRKNLFLMEGMWTRFFPGIKKVREWLKEGHIGDPNYLTADFFLSQEFDPNHRHFNPKLGGGALLDLGIYPLSLATMIWGKPGEIAGHALLAETGVDQTTSVSLKYDKGLASFGCGLTTRKPAEAMISGPNGHIKIHPTFFCPKKVTLTVKGKNPVTEEFPFEGYGFVYQMDAVCKAIGTGKTESELMPLSDTLIQMEVMDELRKRWGVIYPE